MARGPLFFAGLLSLVFLASGLIIIPLSSTVHAQPTVVAVSILKGAGSGPNAAPGYGSPNITLVIGVNNTVKWTNNDTTTHTVTPSSVPPGATWSVGSGDMATSGPTASYTFTFTVPGTYTYACAYHSWMSGTVVVKLLASTSSSSSSSRSATSASTSSTSSTTSSSTTTTSTSLTTLSSSISSSTIISTTPEFPTAYLALILFSVIAAVMLVASRMRGTNARMGVPRLT